MSRSQFGGNIVATVKKLTVTVKRNGGTGETQPVVANFSNIITLRYFPVCRTTNIYNVENRTWRTGPSLECARANFGAATLKSTI